MTIQQLGQNPVVNAPRAKISGKPDRRDGQNTIPCLCCLREYRASRPKQRFCSSRCRLLYWAACEIARQFHEGRAQGLLAVLSCPKDDP
jgi:hypothetical protein